MKLHLLTIQAKIKVVIHAGRQRLLKALKILKPDLVTLSNLAK